MIELYIVLQVVHLIAPLVSAVDPPEIPRLRLRVDTKLRRQSLADVPPSLSHTHRLRTPHGNHSIPGIICGSYD